MGNAAITLNQEIYIYFTRTSKEDARKHIIQFRTDYKKLNKEREQNVIQLLKYSKKKIKKIA